MDQAEIDALVNVVRLASITRVDSYKRTSTLGNRVRVKSYLRKVHDAIDSLGGPKVLAKRGINVASLKQEAAKADKGQTSPAEFEARLREVAKAPNPALHNIVTPKGTPAEGRVKMHNLAAMEGAVTGKSRKGPTDAEANARIIAEARPFATAEDAYKATVANGGVTINLGGTRPTKGIAFAPFKDTEQIVPNGELTPEIIQNYMRDHADKLKDPNNHLGLWEDDGKVYLDISTVGPKNADTLQKAQDANQLGAFDLENFETVPLGKIDENGYTPHHAKATDHPYLNGGKDSGGSHAGTDGERPALHDGGAAAGDKVKPAAQPGKPDSSAKPSTKPDASVQGKPDQVAPGATKKTPRSPEQIADEARRAAASADGIIAKAKDAEPGITGLLKKITEDAGGHLEGLDFRFKGKGSMVRKITTKAHQKGITPEEYAKKIGDAVRYTAVIDPDRNIEGGQKILDSFKAQGHTVESVENSWGEGGAYHGVNIQMAAPNGTRWELQLHTPESLERKFLAHYWYFIYRNEDLPQPIQDEARKRSMGAWTGVERPKGWESFGQQMQAPSADRFIGGTKRDLDPDSQIPGTTEFGKKDPVFQRIAVQGNPNGSGTSSDPISVGADLDAAVALLISGSSIRLDQPEQVSMLVDKMDAYVAEVKAAGLKAPTINLCGVTVKGTSLFCHDTKGIPRVQMPQLSGVPQAGSPAASMLKPGKATVDITEPFRLALADRGISVTRKRVKAVNLKASQNELEGAKVSRLASGIEEGTVPEVGVFTTRDGYIIDGHHRWAANMVVDSKDNALGDITMPVDEVDLDIGAALDFANRFAESMGIAPQGIDSAPVDQSQTGDPGDTPSAAKMPGLDTPGLRNTPGLPSPSGLGRTGDGPDLKQAFESGGAAPLPVGTTRVWQGVKYQKKRNGDWVRVKGQKTRRTGQMSTSKADQVKASNTASLVPACCAPTEDDRSTERVLALSAALSEAVRQHRSVPRDEVSPLDRLDLKVTMETLKRLNIR